MKKTKTLIASLVAIVVCFAMLIGTTYAWFTDSVINTNNIIKSGNVDVELWHASNSKTEYEEVTGTTKLFVNVDGDSILWEPGASTSEKFQVKNVGSLALKYEFRIKAVAKTATAEGKTLTDVLMLKVNGDNNVDYTELFGEGYAVESELLANEDANYTVSISWNKDALNNNDYNVKGGLKLTLGIELVATQLNYESDGLGSDFDDSAEYPEIVDDWDGTADTSWYNDTDTEFTLTSAEQFAGFAKLVDDGNSFEGKTIKLDSDLDLYSVDEDGERVTFDPIGDKVAFEGTFDGQGHTIENLFQGGWDLGYDWYNYGSVGLFGEVKDATIKNVTISGAESFVEGGDVGGITGSATGTCVFENITIEDSTFATYNNGNGGIIGWSGAGEYTFKNIKIAEDVVLAGLWGSFDSSIGGVVGQAEPGATYNFENVEIACRLDVYNDCTASYDYYNYRMCGMIIGRCAKTIKIDGINYPDMSQYNMTFTNVTVNYGDWMNYHYCEPTPGYNNGRGMRVEPGYSYDGLPADYDHSQCVDNHMNLIPFDQIIGGDQLGVKGLKTYDGVTVNYPKN